MSYLLNQATLRVYGGKQATRDLEQEAWSHLSRLLMARKLGRLSGLLGRFSVGKNRRLLERLEKNLRFLEHCGAVRIHKGRIHYTNREIDFGEEGRGTIDIVKTMANALLQAGEDIWGGKKPVSLDVLTERLGRHARNLFYGPTNLEAGAQRSGFYHRARTKWSHPLLSLLASERAARRILVKLNERGAKAERERIMKAYPETKKNIRFVEREMGRVRQMPVEEIKEAFDPRTGDPYTLKVYPARDFNLLATREGKKRQLVPVISDVHLGTETHPKTGDLLRFYQLVVNLRSPAVVHNGDYYDFFVWKATFERILEANQLVANAVDRMSAVLQIFGNHDLALKGMTEERGKLGPNVYVPADGTYYERRTYFEHGHQSDRHNLEGQRRGPWIVKIGSGLVRTALFKALMPNFIEWIELGSRVWFLARSRKGKDAWKAYKVDPLVERVGEVKARLSEEQPEGGPFTPENPLIYVRGHDHGAGYWFTIQDIVKAVSEKFSSRVRYYTTGSWKGDEAYFLVLDYSHPNRVFAYPFIWEPTYDQFVAFKTVSER